MSVSNTSFSASPPVGNFQSRFYPTPTPGLAPFLPGSSSSPHAVQSSGEPADRPKTAPALNTSANSAFNLTTSAADWLSTKGTPNYRLAKQSTVTEEVTDANSELLMGELVAQTYRLIRKALPWQAQMCPRADASGDERERRLSP